MGWSDHAPSRGRVAAAMLGEGALPVRRSRRERCDSASELAKSDPRAPRQGVKPKAVFVPTAMNAFGFGNDPAAAGRGRDPSQRPCPLSKKPNCCSQLRAGWALLLAEWASLIAPSPACTVNPLHPSHS